MSIMSSPSSSSVAPKRASSSHIGKPPKRSKHEAFRAVVGSYLKQKNYGVGEKFRKSEMKLVENKQEFVLRKMMERDLTKHNTFTYSNVLCIRNNPHVVDQHFSRFHNFIESQSEPLHSELKRFYAPILCHLYLDLMRAQNSRAAIEFLHKYSHLIGPVERPEGGHHSKSPMVNNIHADVHDQHAANKITFQRDDTEPENVHMLYFMNLIEAMSTCNKLDALLMNPEVLQFCSTKYVIETTQAIADVVRKFLEHRGHVTILHVLSTWIRVQIVDNDMSEWTDESLFLNDGENEEWQDSDIGDANLFVDADKKPIKTDLDAYVANCLPPVGNDEGNDPAEADTKMDSNLRLCLDTLRETKDDILKAQPDFPRFIRIMERNRGLTSADMDQRECHLVAGFNNSIIQLWPMNEERFTGRNLYHRTPNKSCPWNLNNCGREGEDEIDRDIRFDLNNYEGYNETKFYNNKYEDNSYNDFGGIELRGHGLGVTQVRFSTHFPLLYSVSKDSTMRCWRSENYHCAGIYRGHRYPIWCFDESPVQTFVVTGSKDLTARLWSLEREFPYITYAGHTQDVECVAFHPNGNYIATGSSDLSVRMWDVTSGKLLRVFTDCKQAVCSVAFSPDGRKLAAGGEEKKVRIFDIAAGSQLGELKENTACVSGIAWAEDNTVLATSCRDGTCRLYNINHLSSPPKTSPTGGVNCTAAPAATSSSSSSSAPIMTMSSNCQRLVRVFHNRHKRVCCIGGFNG